MKYIVCQDWKSTSGNHAGMAYLYRKIQEDNANETRLFVIKQYRKTAIIILHLLLITLYLIIKVRKNDVVILTECLVKNIDQTVVAKWIHIFHPKVQVCGMVHLLPSILEKSFSDTQLVRSLSRLNKVFTLGSSLSRFLVTKGINRNKVFTLFHYVDTEYYNRKDLEENTIPKVIVIGALGRDIESIVDIIRNVPDLHFYFCKGRSNVDNYFKGLSNVTLLGYMEEDELKDYMNKSDISLNVMYDTIGSNVICTSLAMGLAIVVSDVGSIHDYCSEKNAIFCKSKTDYINALNMLAHDRSLLESKKSESLANSKKFSIPNYIKILEQTIQK